MPARQMPGERYRHIEHLAREPRAVEAVRMDNRQGLWEYG